MSCGRRLALLLGCLLFCAQSAAIPATAPPSVSSAEAKSNAAGDKSDSTSKLSRLEELTRKLSGEPEVLLKEIVPSDRPSGLGSIRLLYVCVANTAPEQARTITFKAGAEGNVPSSV